MGRSPDGDPQYDSLAATPFVAARQSRDRAWAWAFGVLYTGCLVFCGYAAQHMNPLFMSLTPEFLNDPKNCPLHPEGRRLLGDEPPRFDVASFWQHASLWVCVSAAASLLVAAAFLHLVRHHAAVLARGTIAFQLAVPTLGALALLASGHALQALFMGGLAALTYFVFYLWRNEIASATKLLSVAGHGLASNTGLIGLSVALNLSALLAALPQLAAVAVAFANGDVIPNPARAGSDTCVDAFGDGVPCCAWQPRPYAAYLMAAAGLAAVWTMMTAQQIRVFTVSGAVAQWYFSPPGASTQGNALRSLGHALRPQFGTNAFAGLVITITSALRQQSDADQQSGGGSIWGMIASALASMVEYLTKFATVMASISGEALVPAGKRVTDLFLRNFLEAFATTVWFPSMVLGLASVTLSALWGGAVWGSYKMSHGELGAGANAAVLGALAGTVTLFVLSFLAGVLLSVLDAVFVCFALDRDRQAVSQADLYEELLGVAEERGVGLAVHHPAGEVDVGTAYAPPALPR